MNPMPFCSKCGAELKEGEKFCSSCGTPVDEAQRSTVVTVSDTDANDVANNKIMAVLAYLSWLVLVPIFAAKDSKFARFHVNQGLNLAVVELALWILSAILGVIPVINVIFGIVSWIANIILFVFSIMGIVNAAKGEEKELPIVGKYRAFDKIEALFKK